jgi:hypothetical protein
MPTPPRALPIAILLLAACGCHTKISLPPRVAGQIPADYRLEPARALVIARFDVFTAGQPGFGPIGNPMLIQFHEGEGRPKEQPQDLTFTNADTRVFTSEATRPMMWRYAPPGLMAMSFRPGTYNGLVIAYPDTAHPDRADSIPAPDRAMIFTAMTIPADKIVYIGDIQVKQQYSGTDMMFDRVRMDYAVLDRYDQTVADFRARYPQFKDTPVEKRLATL